MSTAGDSSEQRCAESEMLNALATREGLSLEKTRLPLRDGGWCEVDGLCEEPLVLVEAWAHQGTPKSAQKNKVVSDAFKLMFVERILGRNARKILLLSDPAAAEFFRRSSWVAQAFSAQGVEVVVVELSKDTKVSVQAAQRRQFR